MGLEDYTQTPFVNMAPATKRERFTDPAKYKKDKTIDQNEFIKRTAIGRKNQMEKMQLQMIVNRLASLEKQGENTSEVSG